MPEEKVSYLEPIDDDIVSEPALPSRDRMKSPETPAVPDAVPDRMPEKSAENETLYQKMLASAPVAVSQNDESVRDDAQKVSLKDDADSKVTQLVELASVKGVVHAVKVARRLNDFYVLDQMHDDLANRLYDSLKAKGMITE